MCVYIYIYGFRVCVFIFVGVVDDKIRTADILEWWS